MRTSLAAVCFLLTVFCQTGFGADPVNAKKSEPWVGVHIYWPNPEEIKKLAVAVAPLKVNTIIWEIDYHFAFEKHPELAWPGSATKAQVREVVEVCRTNGIRLIPQFACLSHQSWKDEVISPLITLHPEFDEEGGGRTEYCHSWCPLHPDINPLIFSLLDEIVDAFQCDYFHIGMDEVFALGKCPRCRGKSAPELLARSINDLHKHLVGDKKLTMMMWGDRLLDAYQMGYSEWDASINGTAPTIDLIPKDIIICDWHYGLRFSYPSLPYFAEKGFQVLGATWDNGPAAVSMIDCERRIDSDKVLGHVFTTWHGVSDTGHLLQYPGFTQGIDRLNGGGGPGIDGLLTELDKIDGKAIATVSAKEFAATAARVGAFSSELFPSKDPRVLIVSFPSNTVSAPGQNCAVTVKLPVPKEHGKLRLQAYIVDDFINPQWPGYRFYQILNGESVLWEEDIVTERKPEERWVSFDVSDIAKGQTLELTVRVIDKKAVNIYPTISVIGPIRLVEVP